RNLQGIALRTVLEDEVEQSTELRSVLERRGAAYDLDALQGLRGRNVVALRVAQGVCRDVVAVLSRVEVGVSIRTEAAASETELHAGPVALPDVQAGHAPVDLAAVVRREV